MGDSLTAGLQTVPGARVLENASAVLESASERLTESGLSRDTEGLRDTDYPSRLAAATGRAVFKHGVPGETSTQIATRMAGINFSRRIAIIWMGSNGSVEGPYVPARIVSDFAAAVALVGHENFIVAGALNRPPDNPVDHPTEFAAVVQPGIELAALYGSKYVDIRQILVDSYDPTSPQDVTDFAHNTPPTSLRIDTIHLNPILGNPIVVAAFAQAILDNGYP